MAVSKKQRLAKITREAEKLNEDYNDINEQIIIRESKLMYCNTPDLRERLHAEIRDLEARKLEIEEKHGQLDVEANEITEMPSDDDEEDVDDDDEDVYLKQPSDYKEHNPPAYEAPLNTEPLKQTAAAAAGALGSSISSPNPPIKIEPELAASLPQVPKPKKQASSTSTNSSGSVPTARGSTGPSSKPGSSATQKQQQQQQQFQQGHSAGMLSGSQSEKAAADGNEPGRSTAGASSSGRSILSVLDRCKLQELVSQIDSRAKLDSEVEEVLLEFADNFIEETARFACAYARHRNSNTLELKDVQLHLEKNCGIFIPGFEAQDAPPAPKKTHKDPTELHRRRIDAINRQLNKQKQA